MRRWAAWIAAALGLWALGSGCAKKNIDAATEVPGAVRWYAGVTPEQIVPVVRQIFDEGGFPVTAVDEETGRIETEWGKEFQGGTHGWRLTRWTERQKFIALISRSQERGEKGEELVTVLLQIRWEERPPGGRWRVKEEGGAASQSADFQRFVRELDARVSKLGAKRN
jgi:hypothetical protein